jgi:hypothetical protein
MAAKFFVKYGTALNPFCVVDCNKGFKTLKAAQNFKKRLADENVDSTIEVHD